METILLTGGAGFIGSHTIIELINNNTKLIIVDNLSNSKIDVIDKLKSILKDKINESNFIFYNVDLKDYNQLENIFKSHFIDSIIHFGAYKSVSESINKPIEYYQNNVGSLLNLLQLCSDYTVKNFIFSSSATVYGTSISPLNENSIIGNGILNPYGRSKYFCEKILEDYNKSNKNLKIVILRYFNPVGCHESGLIGEDPLGIPNNIFPIICKTVIQNNFNVENYENYNELKIFGNTYSTKDGTAIRDYIHVTDLATAHVASLKYLNENDINFDIFNVGTGCGTSVLELINKFEAVNNVEIPYIFVEKRDGDMDISVCDTTKINSKLNWYSKKNIEDVCIDAFRYIKFNIE